MMKRKILALLLTAMMIVATLTACRVQNNNNNPGGTEPSQTTPTQTTPNPDQPYIPPVVTWQDVNKSVFTLSDVKLRQEAATNGVALATIPKLTELHCTKQSTSWYYVEYESNGETLQGYVNKTGVTEIDILGTGPNWVAVEGGSKIMYVKPTTLNVRLYPTDAEFSEKKGAYSCNAEVTVLATNGTWARIQYSETEQYYVSLAYLSETPVDDPNNPDKYKDLFTAVEGEPTMYVKEEKVNFRVAPIVAENVTIIMSLSLGTEVTVLKSGTVEGKEWYYVEVYIPADKGVPGYWQEGYISADCLSLTSGSQTLEDLVAFYGFTQVEKTMYVLAENSVYVRSTPSLANLENVIDVLASGKEPATIKSVKVVATGTYNGNNWCLIEHTMKEGTEEKTVYCFIGASTLTSDPNGKQTVTLSELLDKYPEFTECTETTITVSAKAKGFGTPNGSAEVIKEFEAGTELTLVAEETGSRHNIWYVVKDSTGTLYFVGMEFFN